VSVVTLSLLAAGAAALFAVLLYGIFGILAVINAPQKSRSKVAFDVLALLITRQRAPESAIRKPRRRRSKSRSRAGPGRAAVPQQRSYQGRRRRREGGRPVGGAGQDRP
jgi:hypothetical protein